MKSGLLHRLLSTAVFAALSSAAFAGEIAVDIAAAAKAAASDSITVTLTNTSKSPVYLLKWNTPLGEITEDLFDIRFKGERVPYVGKVVKRTYPTASDYVELMPGQSLSGDVELSGVYDLYQSGDYTVRFEGEFQDAISLADSKDAAIAPFVEATSSTIALSIEGTGVSAFANSTIEFGRAVSYASCSSSRQTSLSTAHNSAKTYATNSTNYFSTYTSSTATQRYRTWFGTPSTTRFSAVKSHYTKIRDALNNASVVYDCSCTDSYYAYVYPNSPYRIYLCNAFWTASNTGTDSRAGTIIHEMSHFTVNGGTDDHVYGQSGAKSLATSNPNKATDNADSHEYFSENTPAQN